MPDQWGFNPNTVNAVATALGSLTFIVALFSAISAYRQQKVAEIEAQKGRNLQAILAISTDYRNRWERDWEQILREKVPKISLRA